MVFAIDVVHGLLGLLSAQQNLDPFLGWSNSGGVKEPKALGAFGLTNALLLFVVQPAGKPTWRGH